MKKIVVLYVILVRSYKRLLPACLVLLLVCTPGIKVAATSEFSISKVEPVQITQDQRSDNTRMSFSAFGRTFNLLLQKNNTLSKNISSRLPEIDLYVGTVEGVAGSWARISVVSGEYSGAVFDGNEMFMIDTGKRVSDAVDESQKELMLQSNTVVYKAADMTSNLTDHIAD